jgi:hypothetical protein
MLSCVPLLQNPLACGKREAHTDAHVLLHACVLEFSGAGCGEFLVGSPRWDSS